MAFRKGTRGTLSVDENLPEPASDPVLFALCDVVADIVDDLQIGISEDRPAGLPDTVCHELPVREGKVCPRRHRTEIPPSLAGGNRHACKLAVDDADAVLFHTMLHQIEIVCANLVAEAPRSAVDQHDHLPFAGAEPPRGDGIEDFGHASDFHKR